MIRTRRRMFEVLAAGGLSLATTNEEAAMAFQIHTNEVSVETVGHPLSVEVEPEVQAPDSEPAVSIVHIELGERDDGAVGGTLNVRGEADQLARLFQEISDKLGRRFGSL